MTLAPFKNLLELPPLTLMAYRTSMENSLPTITLVGVTGYGAVHLQHLLHLHDSQQVCLREAVVVNPAEASDALSELSSRGVQIADNLETLVSKSPPPDWVCLPVGIPYHRSLTHQALNWGANVLLEKPAAGDLQDWAVMCKDEKESGKEVHIAFQHMHDPTVQRLKHALVSGVHGQIRSLELEGSWPRDDAYYKRNRWAGRRKLDGVAVNDSPIQNAFAHFINLGLFFYGRDIKSWSKALSVDGELFRFRPEIETFDACHLRFELDDGIPFTVTLTHADPENRDPVLRLHTEKDCLEWRETEPPHTHMFREILVEGITRCRLQDAGAHLAAMQLTMDHLSITPCPFEKSG